MRICGPANPPLAQAHARVHVIAQEWQDLQHQQRSEAGRGVLQLQQCVIVSACYVHSAACPALAPQASAL